MPLDSVLSVIGSGPLTPNQPSDSLRLVNGFRTQVFLVKGEQYRLIWFREAPGSIEEEISRERETPILLGGSGQVVAKGWADFDSKAADLGLPNPYRTRERLDSMSNAQLAKP